MYSSSIILLCYIILSNIFFTSAQQPQRPPPGQVAVNSIGVDFSKPAPNNGANGTWDPSDSLVTEGGTGCRAGTVGTVLAADNSFLTLIFDNFIAQVGPNVTANQRRAFCRINVNLKAPSGWSFDIDSADYRGFVELDQGVTGTVKSSYEFVGEQGRGDLTKTVQGPTNTDFLVHQNGEVANKVHRGCGRASTAIRLSVAIAVATRDRNAQGFIQTDSADAAFHQNVNLNWTKCSPPSIRGSRLAKLGFD